MCGGEGGEGKTVKEGERERDRERERELVVYPQVCELVFCFSLILFHVMGLVLQRRNGTEENTLLLLSLSLRRGSFLCIFLFRVTTFLSTDWPICFQVL